MLAFDYTSLAHEITAACRRAFADLARAHPDEVPCAFALYSDEGAMTVCPAFDLPSQRAARIAAEPDAAAYYTFSTAEWSLEGFGADPEFEAICTRVRTHVFAIEADDDVFIAFRERLFETCIQVLARLRTGAVAHRGCVRCASRPAGDVLGQRQGRSGGGGRAPDDAALEWR